VVWVGGMFAAYVCLRPAAGALEPSQRLPLWRRFFVKFLPWVWVCVLLLLLSGYWMLLTSFGGFAGAPLYINLMQAIGWAMIALFVWLFHGPWLKFKRAVDAENWPVARATQSHPRHHHGQPAAGPDRGGHRRHRTVLGDLIFYPPWPEEAD
jgi:uncharacterized membrane protein